MTTIFLSHASADRKLALKIKELLAAALERVRPRVVIFCSSDVGDIQGGKKWFDQIMDHLKQAAACVSLMTPQSIFYSPWVSYESGGAYLRFETNPKRSRLFPVCANGIKARTVPPPFNELQVRDLASREEIGTLCREIAKSIGGTSRTPRRLVGELADLAARGAPHWDLVQPALVGQRQGSSPFNLDSLISEATTEIFCAGFNLHYIATTSRCKRDIFDFLRHSAGRTVRLLIANPKAHRRLMAWELVGPTFASDLRQAFSHFQIWLREAKRQKLQGTLEIGVTDFVGVTVVCIDPQGSNAQLVLTPTIVGKPLSADRPHFLLTRARQPVALSYYWDSYQDLFKRSTPLSQLVKPNKRLQPTKAPRIPGKPGVRAKRLRG